MSASRECRPASSGGEISSPRSIPLSPRGRGLRSVGERSREPTRSWVRGKRLCCLKLLTHASRRSPRSEEHTSELQSLMRISYAVFCLKKNNNKKKYNRQH